ncbi:MAG: hypothetical protein NTX50_06130 [Candidatus Sumerlaeota bacterium]|nr:hypothetical protein [Candidatus Sumerlaeota bacterium]
MAALDHAFSDDVKTVLLAPAAYAPDPDYAATTKVERKFRFRKKEVQQEREEVQKDMVNSLKAIQENLSDRKPVGE